MLAVLFGNGRAAEEVYKNRHCFPEDTIYAAIVAKGSWLAKPKEHWLSKVDATTPKLDPLDPDEYSAFFAATGITKVCIVGEVWRSFRWRDISKYPKMLGFVRRAATSGGQVYQKKLPHSLLLMIGDMFCKLGIPVLPLKTYFPKLTGKPGEYYGTIPKADAKKVFDHAKTQANDIKKQNMLWVTQCYIYGVRDKPTKMGVLKKEGFGTDRLLNKFSESHYHKEGWDRFKFVKVAIDDFANLDTPVFGIDAARKCINAGIECAVLEGDVVLVFQKEEVIKLCSESNFNVIFV